MSPPREDEWAGCLGLLAAILTFCPRNRLGGVTSATVCTGLLGGRGFALAATKLLSLRQSSCVAGRWASSAKRSMRKCEKSAARRGQTLIGC